MQKYILLPQKSRAIPLPPEGGKKMYIRCWRWCGKPDLWRLAGTTASQRRGLGSWKGGGWWIIHGGGPRGHSDTHTHKTVNAENRYVHRVSLSEIYCARRLLYCQINDAGACTRWNQSGVIIKYDLSGWSRTAGWNLKDLYDCVFIGPVWFS